MARMAIIDGDLVENIVEAEPGFTLDGKLVVEATADAVIGGTYSDGVFSLPSPPQPEAPEIISRRQFYQGLAETEKITKVEALAAIKTGAVPTALQVMLDAMTDPDEKFKADMLLSGASEFQRSHPLVSVIAAAEGMSEQDVDDFWLLCARL